jgi:hypothetical protein
MPNEKHSLALCSHAPQEQSQKAHVVKAAKREIGRELHSIPEGLNTIIMATRRREHRVGMLEVVV